MKLTIGKVSLAVIGATTLIGWNFYAKLPNLMATHWDLSNKVNGYTEKFWFLTMMPALMLGLLCLMLVLPRLDPKVKNIKTFSTIYEGLVLLMMLFLSYMQILVILFNLGYAVNMTQLIAPGLSILFTYIGFVMKNAKQNWTVGIRTPWTLSSENVWNKTHIWAGKWLLICSPLLMLGLLVPSITFYLIAIPILVLLGSVIYSYRLSR